MKWMRICSVVLTTLGLSAMADAGLLNVGCGPAKACGCGPTDQPACCQPKIMYKPVVCRPKCPSVHTYQRQCLKPASHDACCAPKTSCCPKSKRGCGNNCGNNACGPKCGAGAPAGNCGPAAANCGPAAANCAAPAGPAKCGPAAAANCAAPAHPAAVNCGPAAAANCAAPAGPAKCGPAAAANCAAPAHPAANCGPAAAANCAAPAHPAANCGPAAANCAAPAAAGCGPAAAGCGPKAGCGVPSTGTRCCKANACDVANLIYVSQTACYAKDRRNAVRKLGKYDCVCNPEIMCAFVYALNDCDERVRAEAADEIGHQVKRNPCCCSEKVSHALMCALGDCDRKVRNEAEFALKQCGYEVANCKTNTCGAAKPGCGPVACGTPAPVAPAHAAPVAPTEAAPMPAPAAAEPEAYFPSRIRDSQTNKGKVRNSLSNLFGLR